MFRICLMLLALGLYSVSGQQKSKYLLLAEKLKATNTQQSIPLAKKAFTQAIMQKDSYNAYLAGMFLSDAYRKEGNYIVAIYYDSLAVLQAQLRPQDTLLQQKARNSYARNYVEELRTDEAENMLIKNTILFTSYYTIETCVWYEMRALNNFNRIRIGDAIALSRKAREVAQLIQDSTAIMHAGMMVFKFQSMLLQADSMGLAFDALAYFEKTKNNVYAAQAANIIGYAFETTHKLDKAIEYYQKALQHNIATGTQKEIMYSRMHLADVYKAQGAFDLAKPLLYEEFQYFSRIHFPKGIASATIRLAKIYSDAEQFDSAIIFFKLTDKVNEQLHLKVLMAGSYAWQAQMQAKLKNFRQSDSLAELAITGMLQEQHQEIGRIATLKIKEAGSMADADVQKPNRLLLKDSRVVMQLPPAQQMKVSDYEKVKSINWQTGDRSDRDSTYRERNSRQQLEAESKYRVGRYRDTLETEKQHTAKATGYIYSLRWMLATIAVVLLAVSVGLYRQYKRRKQAEQEKMRMELMLKEAHHRVKNNLENLKATVELSATTTLQNNPVDDLITRIDTIALLHQHLYEGKQVTEKVQMQPYLEALMQSVLFVHKTGKPIQTVVDAAVEVAAETAMILGFIINELVTNSLKYAFADKESGSIAITIVEKERQLYLTVADNGTGLPDDRKAGFGTQLIKDLSHQLRGKYSYQTRNGTTFNMTLAATQ